MGSLKLSPSGPVYLDAPTSQRWEAGAVVELDNTIKTRELGCPSSTCKFSRLQPKNQTE
jgi:hypothetical protein